MFTVFKKWPRISKLVLKSILLTVNLVHCRFKFNRYSYNSCTQPSKRQPHKYRSRNSDERGRIPRTFKDVLIHLSIMPFDVVFGVRRWRIKLKGICLERNWRVSWCFKQGNNPWNAAKNSEVIHRPVEGNPRQSLSVELGLWIPIVSGTPDSLSCSLDSKA